MFKTLKTAAIAGLVAIGSLLPVRADSMHFGSGDHHRHGSRFGIYFGDVGRMHYRDRFYDDYRRVERRCTPGAGALRGAADRGAARPHRLCRPPRDRCGRPFPRRAYSCHLLARAGAARSSADHRAQHDGKLCGPGPRYRQNAGSHVANRHAASRMRLGRESNAPAATVRTVPRHCKQRTRALRSRHALSVERRSRPRPPQLAGRKPLRRKPEGQTAGR